MNNGFDPRKTYCWFTRHLWNVDKEDQVAEVVYIPTEKEKEKEQDKVKITA